MILYSIVIGSETKTLELVQNGSTVAIFSCWEGKKRGKGGEKKGERRKRKRKKRGGRREENGRLDIAPGTRPDGSLNEL